MYIVQCTYSKRTHDIHCTIYHQRSMCQIKQAAKWILSHAYFQCAALVSTRTYRVHVRVLVMC